MSKITMKIIGAGTYGEAMCELAEMTGYSVDAFIDDDRRKIGSVCFGKPITMTVEQLLSEELSGQYFAVAIGKNEDRRRIMDEINLKGGITPTLIHPDSTISPTAVIGIGVYIQAGARIWTKVEIGDYSIISVNATVAHHAKIGKACLLSTQASIGAGVTVGEGAFLGMSSIVITGVCEICPGTVIGAGAVVIRDIHKSGVYVGSPARLVKDLSK